MAKIDELLTAAQVEYKQARFSKPPRETYAVWFDDCNTDGSDDKNQLLRHGYTVEMYEYTPDSATESALEAVLDTAGLRWSKQSRFWIETEQLYQVIYTFDYIEKRRN